MKLLISHINDPPMCEMGIARTVKKCCVAVYLEETRATILGEVSTLGETMGNVYEELMAVHKAIFHLRGL